MKKFLLMIAFTAVAITSTFAQDDHHSSMHRSHHYSRRHHRHTEHRNNM